MKMMKNRIQQAQETALRTMLMAAMVFCMDPSAFTDATAKMKAGMAQKRQMKEVPQNSRMKESRIAPSAKTFSLSLGGNIAAVAPLG